MHDNSEQQTIIAEEKKLLLLEIDEFISNEVSEETIQKQRERVLRLVEVPVFDGFGIDKRMDKEFEKNCLMIRKESNVDAKKLTVFEFYNLIEMLNGAKE